MKKKLRTCMVICMLFSLLYMLLPQNLFAEDNMRKASPISTFSIAWSTKSLAGAVEYDENDTTKVTITPTENKIKAPGTSISAQVKLDLTDASVDKNALKIKLPKFLFKNRNNEDAGSYTIGLPEGQEQSNFSYSESADGKYLIIVNTQEITHAMTLLFDVTYYSYNEKENLLPNEIPSGCSSNLQAEIYLNDTLYDTSETLQMNYQTNANLISVEKVKHKKWETWQSEWGTAPTDTKDFFYICWSIRGELAQSSVRPLKIEITDIPSNGGSVVGWFDYKFDDNFIGVAHAHNDFVKSNTSKVIEQDITNIGKKNFLTHVVVRYPRTELDKGKKIENNVIINISDLYSIDTPRLQQSKTASAAYEYVDFKFTYPLGRYDLLKAFTNYQNWGAGISKGYFNIMENAKIGEELPEVFGHWMNTATSIGGILTKDENLPENDKDSYGKNPYTVELVDDFVSMENERLTEKDYAFTTANVFFDEANLHVNEDGGPGAFHTDSPDVNYTAWQDAELYRRTELHGEWSKVGTFTCDANKKFNFRSVDGEVQYDVKSTSPIKLPEGTVGLKLVHKSKYYKNILRLETRMLLRKTDHVTKLIKGKNSVMVNNVDTLRILNYKDEWINPQKVDTIQGNDKIKEQIIERDTIEFGDEKADHYGIHQNANLSLESISTDSVMKKEIKSVQNDKANERFSINYQAYVFELAYSNYFDPFDKQANPASVDEQRTGTFYDLLPKGMYVDINGIKVGKVHRAGAYQYMSYGDCDYTAELIENWRGSGRTMMILHTSVKKGEINHEKYTNITPDGWEWESGFFVDYKGYYPWESYFDYGGNLVNSLAYKSGNGVITNGYPDQCDTSFIDKKWFDDLDGDGLMGESAPKDTLYSSASTTINGDTSSKLGYFKSVKNQQEFRYQPSTEVLTGEMYSYRLQYSSNKNAKTKNLVLYDVLEDKAEGKEYWKGTLQSVDISSAISKGIDAKVLYSTKENIQLSNENAGLKNDANIDNDLIWTTEKPKDASKITAVAVDLRMTIDGQPFILNGQQQVSAIIHMKAPLDNVKEYMQKQVKAYNSSWVNANSQVSEVEWSDSLLETNETTVAVREPEIEIHKTSTPASGTVDAPAKVKNHDDLIYDVSVKNNETSLLLNAIKVKDDIPSGLHIKFDDIAWYIGKDPTKQQLVKDSDMVQVVREKQQLTFTIQALQAGEELHFVIPTEVMDNGDDRLFVNTAKIIEVNAHPFEKESETTYHELDIQTANFKFNKVDDEDNYLANANFVAYELNCTDTSHDHSKDLLKVDENGNLKQTNPCWKKRISAISQEVSGSVELKDLNIEKQYMLIEYKAPIGFVLPDGQWNLKYDENSKAFNITGSIHNPPAFEKTDTGYKVTNYRPGEIPVTGSSGYDDTLYLIGTGCILCGSFMFWRKRRKLKES